MTLEEAQRLSVEAFKFLGTVLGATVAVYALLTDGIKTIRKDGHLTKKGRWLVTLAVGGATLSGVLQMLEFADALDNANRMAARFESLIKAAENISEPVDVNGIELDATLAWDASEGRFAVWRKRLLAYLPDAVANARKSGETIEYSDSQARTKIFLPNGSLTILSGSDLLPSEENRDEASAFNALNAVGLVVTICRGKPKSAPESERASERDNFDAPLEYLVAGSLSKGSFGENSDLAYWPGAKKPSFSVHIDGLALSLMGIRKPPNRFFRGVTDFVGARIEAKFLDADVLPLADSGFSLDLGKGSTVFTTNDSMQVYRNTHGEIVVSGCLARHRFDSVDKNAECRQHCDVLLKQYAPNASPRVQ
jgi:hypothetical protein